VVVVVLVVVVVVGTAVSTGPVVLVELLVTVVEVVEVDVDVDVDVLDVVGVGEVGHGPQELAGVPPVAMHTVIACVVGVIAVRMRIRAFASVPSVYRGRTSQSSWDQSSQLPRTYGG
jgi:hypothetical protein